MIRRPPRSTLFPTRRSSDLTPSPSTPLPARATRSLRDACSPAARCGDRKSTRLNSSHDQISYAVFCLKKKNHMESYMDLYIIKSCLRATTLVISSMSEHELL